MHSYFNSHISIKNRNYVSENKQLRETIVWFLCNHITELISNYFPKETFISKSRRTEKYLKIEI